MVLIVIFPLNTFTAFLKSVYFLKTSWKSSSETKSTKKGYKFSDKASVAVFGYAPGILVKQDFKELTNKAQGSLGYWDKNVKKTISAMGNDYKTHEKDKDTKIQSQIYLFPMVGLNWKTKKGKKFEVYSLGSAENFMIYSNF